MLSEDRHIISRAAEQQAAAQPQCQWAGQRHGGVAFPWEWSSGLDIWTLASERAYGWRLAGGPVRRCCASTRNTRDGEAIIGPRLQAPTKPPTTPVSAMPSPSAGQTAIPPTTAHATAWFLCLCLGTATSPQLVTRQRGGTRQEHTGK
jgi:hypothetical protein